MRSRCSAGSADPSTDTRRVARALTPQVGNDGGMAKRRPRGSLIDPVGVHWDVEREYKQKFEAIAEKADVSAAVLFELVVANLPLTDQGIPVWMPERSRDGELPIDTA